MLAKGRMRDFGNRRPFQRVRTPRESPSRFSPPKSGRFGARIFWSSECLKPNFGKNTKVNLTLPSTKSKRTLLAASPKHRFLKHKPTLLAFKFYSENLRSTSLNSVILKASISSQVISWSLGSQTRKHSNYSSGSLSTKRFFCWGSMRTIFLWTDSIALFSGSCWERDCRGQQRRSRKLKFLMNRGSSNGSWVFFYIRFRFNS